jgi:Asp-tRNA(Asn)/Glu-tRNA(Gln) amidotransferase A subunit family amidase
MTSGAFASAAELARLIASGALSPVEYFDAVLARIERVQATLNPFITGTAKPARAAASFEMDRTWAHRMPHSGQ